MIEFRTEKQIKDCTTLVSVRRKYIEMIKAFFTDHKVSLIDGMESPKDPEALIRAYSTFIQNYSKRIENLNYILNEFHSFKEKITELLKEEISETVKRDNIENWIALMCWMEFECFVDGVKIGMNAIGA